MTYINPITGALLPGATAQERISADKTRQLRRREAARHDSTAGDSYEPVVESSEEVAAVHEELKDRKPPRERPRRKKPNPSTQDAEQHIDLKA